MEIFFCDVCGHRVSDAQIERGEAIQVGELVFCSECRSKAPQPEPQAAPGPRPPRRRPPTSKHSTHAAHERPRGNTHLRNTPVPARNPQVVMFAVAAGGGMLVSIVLVLLLSGGSSETQPLPQPQAQAPRLQPVGPVAPVAVPQPKEDPTTKYAKAGFDAATAYERDNPTDAVGQLQHYESVISSWAGTPYEKEAQDRIYAIRVRAADRLSELDTRRRDIGMMRTPPAPIQRAGSTPTIDGNLEEWPTLPIVVTEPLQILYTRHSWTGASDCSWSFGVSYDDRGAYIAIRVTDDTFVSAPGAGPDMQDGVVIDLDARLDPERSQGRGEEPNNQFLRIAIAPKADGSCTIADRAKLPAELKVASRTSGTGYTIEVGLPDSYMEDLQASEPPWASFRLNISVCDFDGEPGDRNYAAMLNWQPRWDSDINYRGSGTFVRRTPMKWLPRVPTVDGDLDDWRDRIEEGPFAVISRADQFCNGDIKKWSGPEDMSARVYAGWTSGGLYIAVDVTDDSYVADPVGTHPWQYDCVEVFFDIRSEEEQEKVELTRGADQICISPAEPGRLRPRWNVYGPREKEGIEGFNARSMQTPRGYTMEILIPINDITYPNAKWEAGQPVKFAIIVNDKDVPTSKGREYCFGWARSPNGNNFRDTSGWRRMVLTR